MSSLPPKIDIQIEDAGNRQGKSTIIVTLSRQSQTGRSTKQNYADMVVGSEEDNTILFHEKIRAQEFSSPYSVKLFVPCPQSARVTLKVDLIFEEHVGIDIHKKHVVSREDDLHVTKVCEVEKPKHLSSLPAQICLVGSRPTGANPSQSYIGRSPLSKEVCVIEDDDGPSAPEKADNMQGTRKFNNLASLEVPSFDLLLEEDDGDMQDVSVSGPAEAGCKSASSKTIFDHIRKKSRDFPTLMLSKSMDSSYEPLILKKMKTSIDQFDLDQEGLLVNEVKPMDSERTEARISPTTTAEKCRRILGITSEKSCSLFTEKTGSPFEKSKILSRTQHENSLRFAASMDSPSEEINVPRTTPDEKSRQFAGKRDSSFEKSKILNRVPDESSLQFAAKRDNQSEKSKILWTPHENYSNFAGKRDSPFEKSKILSRAPDETSLQFASRGDSPPEKVLWINPDENSSQFAGTRDSPYEKNKILITPPNENYLRFAGNRESPSEKSKVLSRTPHENCPPFAGSIDSPSEKNKFCFASPIADFQAMQCTKQVASVVESQRIQGYIKDILGGSKGSETGASFLGFKSVFSFL